MPPQTPCLDSIGVFIATIALRSLGGLWLAAWREDVQIFAHGMLRGGLLGILTGDHRSSSSLLGTREAVRFRQGGGAELSAEVSADAIMPVYLVEQHHFANARKTRVVCFQVSAMSAAVAISQPD